MSHKADTVAALVVIAQVFSGVVRCITLKQLIVQLSSIRLG